MSPKLQVSCTTRVDWLSYTYHGLSTLSLSREEHAASNVHPSVLSADDTDWEYRKPILKYRSAVQSQNGSMVLWSNNRLEMGVHVSQSGQVFDRLEALDVLRNALRKGAKVARLDVAIDIHRKLPLYRWKKAHAAGRAVTPAKTARYWEDSPGETLYIGAKESDVFFRAYDKAAEQKAPGEWFRLELQAKHDVAQKHAERLDNEGYEVIPCIILEFIDFPGDRDWRIATRSDCVKGTYESDRHLTDTRKWLLTQCARALAKEIQYKPEFLSEFLEQVTKHGTSLAPK